MNIQPMTMDEYKAAWLEAERELMICGYPLKSTSQVPDAVVIDTSEVGCIALPDGESDEDAGSDDGA